MAYLDRDELMVARDIIIEWRDKDEWSMNEDELAALGDLCDAVDQVPGFHDFAESCERFLTNYPPDVFVGGGQNTDPGVAFVVAIRKAVAKLAEDLRAR